MTGMEGPPSLLHMKLLEVNGLLLKVVNLIFFFDRVKKGMKIISLQ